MKKQPKKHKKKISPPSQEPRRKLGVYGNKVKIADDFDAPLPDEILSAFEGWSDEEDKH